MTNNYQIFFTYEDQVLELPHNPETMPVELGGENQAYNVLGIGPITIPRIPKQKRIRIESYFPFDAEIVPETYIKFFQDAMYEQRILVYTPVRAYEDGTPYYGGDDGFQCLVENFSVEERGGETGDFYYSLEIVEYRDYSPTIIDVRPVQTGYALSTTPTRTSDGPQVGDYVSVSGPVYLYNTNEEPIAETNNLLAFFKRKEERNGEIVATVTPTEAEPLRKLPNWLDSMAVNPAGTYVKNNFESLASPIAVNALGSLTQTVVAKLKDVTSTTVYKTSRTANDLNMEDSFAVEPIGDGILSKLIDKLTPNNLSGQTKKKNG